MSAVLYVRLPEALKQALAEHAARRGLSQTRAAVALLEQGLEAAAGEHSFAELEGRLAHSESEQAGTWARLREAELALAAARERELLTARTYRALAARARQARTHPYSHALRSPQDTAPGSAPLLSIGGIL